MVIEPHGPRVNELSDSMCGASISSTCWPLMAVPGQKRHFDHASTTSGLAREADILWVSRHVSNVPNRRHGQRHSMTSSASASSVGGGVSPSNLAVLRLMMKLNLVGAC